MKQRGQAAGRSFAHKERSNGVAPFPVPFLLFSRFFLENDLSPAELGSYEVFFAFPAPFLSFGISFMLLASSR
jgi:hypothetical protein